jgi:hypothetical protein
LLVRKWEKNVCSQQMALVEQAMELAKAAQVGCYALKAYVEGVRLQVP